MDGTSKMEVVCPICSAKVSERSINQHIDSGCTSGPLSSTTLPSKTLAPIFTSSQSKVKTRQSDALAPYSSSPASSDIPVEESRPVKRPKLDSESRALQKASISSSLAPLAERMRPQSLDDFVGHQEHVGPGTLLRSLIDSGTCGSLLLWGPPGSGKTTLARIIARSTNSIIKELSASSAGSADVRSIFDEAKNVLSLSGKRTVLFVDEIQRFNKAQQDLFLPFVERGWVQLIAATTENPSFKVVGALLSRCRVVILQRISDADIMKIVLNAIDRFQDSIDQEHAVLASDPSILECIVSLSMGDARTALNLVELVLQAPTSASEKRVLDMLKNTTLSRYDRSGDDRYDMISALHKSVRGSDGSAALYWLARMLTAGEDPLYIARRLIVVASEDVGLADPHALPLATAAYFACQNIGMPECRINLAHCVSYLAEAKKSIRSYEAFNRAEAGAKRTPTSSVPMAVRNAPTRFMEALGYGAEYTYNPTFAHPVTNEYLPKEVKDIIRADGPFLRTEEDYKKERAWSEEGLKRWEEEVNEGKEWELRKARAHTQ